MNLPINKIIWFACVTYLFYLASVTQTILYYDALGYHQNAQILWHKGWLGYWGSGLNREPLYSWFVSLSLRFADWLKMDYVPILLLGQVLLFIGMLCLLDRLLTKLKINDISKALVLLYAVFSPALINTTFIEWSEIITYPIVILVILSCIKGWKYLYNEQASVRGAFLRGVFLALSMGALTSVKAVSEQVAIFLIGPWMYAVWKWRKSARRSLLSLGLVIGFISVYWTAINIYKEINWHYNGQYVLTDRGSWALYGNTARRTAALSSRQWLAAVLSVPTNGEECFKLLNPPDECRYWTFTVSDQLGEEARERLQKQKLPLEEVNKTLVKESVIKMVQKPFQTAALMVMEAMKFMFWEYNARLEYAVFPNWLNAVYTNAFLHGLLHYGMALVTLISLIYAVVFMVKRRKILFEPEAKDFESTVVIFFTSFFILLFILFYSFFYCSGRYAMPLVPLFLLLIAFWFKRILSFGRPLDTQK